MNYALPEKSSPWTVSNHRLERSLRTKMKALQERLDNFTVLDKDGTPAGDVRNLVLHQQQLSLVIVQPDVHRHWRFVLLSCHLVDRISLHDRVVQVRITQADMSYLPEHSAVQPLEADRAKEQSKLIAFSQPLPTSLLTDHTQRVERAPKTASGWLTAQKGLLQPPATKKEASLLDAPATPKVLASAMNTTDPQSPHLTHQANPSSTFPFSSREDSLRLPPEVSQARSIALPGSAPTMAAVVASSAQPLLVKGEFTSPKQASQLLEAIAKTLSHRCKTIRIEIEVEDPALQRVCQEWLNQSMAMSKN